MPRSRLARAVREIRAISARHDVQVFSARHDVPVFTLAHAADGNLHPIIVGDPDLGRLPDAAWEAAGEIFALALRLGGTPTGEHGVGCSSGSGWPRNSGPPHTRCSAGSRRCSIRGAFSTPKRRCEARVRF